MARPFVVASGNLTCTLILFSLSLFFLFSLFFYRVRGQEGGEGPGTGGGGAEGVKGSSILFFIAFLLVVF